MQVHAADAVLRGGVDQRAANLLALTEDQWFERKSARISPKALAQSLSAMANSDGGVLVVGMHNGKVEGVDSLGSKLNDLQQASRDFCEPRVPESNKIVDCIFNLQRRKLLVFTVPPSDQVHRMSDGDAFLRVGDEKRKLSPIELVELQYDKSQGSFEESEVKAATLDDLDPKLIEEYAARVRHPDPPRLLRDRTMSSAARITVAGCLLFASNPSTFLPSALVRVTRWSGTARATGSRQNITSDRRLEGPIPAVIEQARSTLRQIQPVRRALTDSGRFEELATVPEEAWLEGLVNAVLHRSYSLGGDHIHIDVFDDRIEITSPGPFPHRVDLSNLLQAQRFARNPRIVRVCSDLGLCQEMGEGIRRIFEEMRFAGLSEPLYRQSRHHVTLTLSSEPANRDIDARYRAEAAAVLTALREHGRLSTSELAAVVKRSRPAARHLLGIMRKAGLIDWVGKSTRDPRAYWRLNESQR